MSNYNQNRNAAAQPDGKSLPSFRPVALNPKPTSRFSHLGFWKSFLIIYLMKVLSEFAKTLASLNFRNFFGLTETFNVQV